MNSKLEDRLQALVSLWRGGGRGRPLSAKEVERASKALLSLQRGLTGARRLAGAGYMEDPDLLGAYLLYYWPVSYMQVSLAASSLGSPDGRSLRVLDLGSGPGPASAALLDRFSGREVELFLADGSAKALDLARSILDSGAARPSRLETFAVNLERLIASNIPPGPYDIIVMSHVLNELWRGAPDRLERRQGLVEAQAARLAPGGSLLLLEPALLETSRELLALRDRLVAAGFRILSPCLRGGACPALAAGPSHSCHAEVPWEPPEPVASLARAAGLDRVSVKMSYLLLAPAASEGGVATKASESSPESSSGILRARVVSEPLLNKAGRVRFLLCNEAGRFALSAKRDDPTARAQGFFSLRRCDLVEAGGLVLRGEASGPAGAPPAYGFGPATSLRVVERLGD
jgi:SAM-dependent methyltransferase